jgi:hypothetical protein
MKCVTWFPHGLNLSISLPPSFFTHNISFHILGALMGSIPFVEFFVIEAFQQDPITIV